MGGMVKSQKTTRKKSNTWSKGRGGRVPQIEKLTARSMQSYLKSIRDGAYAHDACFHLGIGYKQWFVWMARGRNADPGDPADSLYAEFHELTTNALAQARESAAKQVRIADPKWWLANGQAKQDWSPKQETNITVNGEVTQQVIHREAQQVERPAPLSHLAQAIVLLQEMGIVPKNTPEAQRILQLSNQPKTVEEEETIIDADFEESFTPDDQPAPSSNGNGKH